MRNPFEAPGDKTVPQEPSEPVDPDYGNPGIFAAGVLVFLMSIILELIADTTGMALIAWFSALGALGAWRLLDRAGNTTGFRILCLFGMLVFVLNALRLTFI